MSVEAALRTAADALHKIGAAGEARRRLDRDGHKLSQPMHDALVGKLLDPAEIAKLTADGFEVCVRALAELGVKDVAIHKYVAADSGVAGEDLIP